MAAASTTTRGADSRNQDAFAFEFKRAFDNACADIQKLASRYTAVETAKTVAGGVAATTVATASPFAGGGAVAGTTRSTVDGAIGLLIAVFTMRKIKNTTEQIECAVDLSRVLNRDKTYRDTLSNALILLLYRRFQFSIECMAREQGITVLARFFTKVILDYVIESAVQEKAREHSSEKPYVQVAAEVVTTGIIHTFWSRRVSPAADESNEVLVRAIVDSVNKRIIPDYDSPLWEEYKDKKLVVLNGVSGKSNWSLQGMLKRSGAIAVEGEAVTVFLHKETSPGGHNPRGLLGGRLKFLNPFAARDLDKSIKYPPQVLDSIEVVRHADFTEQPEVPEHFKPYLARLRPSPSVATPMPLALPISALRRVGPVSASASSSGATVVQVGAPELPPRGSVPAEDPDDPVSQKYEKLVRAGMEPTLALCLATHQLKLSEPRDMSIESVPRAPGE